MRAKFMYNGLHYYDHPLATFGRVMAEIHELKYEKYFIKKDKEEYHLVLRNVDGKKIETVYSFEALEKYRVGTKVFNGNVQIGSDTITKEEIVELGNKLGSLRKYDIDRENNRIIFEMKDYSVKSISLMEILEIQGKL